MIECKKSKLENQEKVLELESLNQEIGSKLLTVEEVKKEQDEEMKKKIRAYNKGISVHQIFNIFFVFSPERFQKIL